MRTGSGLEPSQHNVTKAMVNHPKIYHKWFGYYINVDYCFTNIGNHVIPQVVSEERR